MEQLALDFWTMTLRELSVWVGRVKLAGILVLIYWILRLVIPLLRELIRSISNAKVPPLLRYLMNVGLVLVLPALFVYLAVTGVRLCSEADRRDGKASQHSLPPRAAQSDLGQHVLDASYAEVQQGPPTRAARVSSGALN